MSELPLKMDEIINYKDQIEEFFVTIRKLNGSGLNPRANFTSKHVCESNLEEVFGKVTKLKNTNNKLQEDTRRELISLYTDIHDTNCHKQ